MAQDHGEQIAAMHSRVSDVDRQHAASKRAIETLVSSHSQVLLCFCVSLVALCVYVLSVCKLPALLFVYVRGWPRR